MARVKALGQAKARDLAACNILFPPDDAAYLKSANAGDKTADISAPTDATAPVSLCISVALLRYLVLAWYVVNYVERGVMFLNRWDRFQLFRDAFLPAGRSRA